jgi:hypothetical protein
LITVDSVSASNWRTSAEPTKPAPPVTKRLFIATLTPAFVPAMIRVAAAPLLAYAD